MPLFRRIWPAGAILVGVSSVAMAASKLAFPVTLPFGVLVVVLGLTPGLGAFAELDRRAGRPIRGLVLLVGGIALVVVGAVFAAREEFLDLRLATGDWRGIVRGVHALAPIGLVVLGAAFIIAGVAVLRRDAFLRTISTLIAAAVAGWFAASTMAVSVYVPGRQMPMVFDTAGLVTAAVLLSAALLLLAGIPLLRRLQPDEPGEPGTSWGTGAVQTPGGTRGVPGAEQRSRRRAGGVPIWTLAVGILVAAGVWTWRTWGPRYVIAEVFPDHALAVCVSSALGRPDVSAAVSTKDLESVRSLTCNGDLAQVPHGSGSALSSGVDAAAASVTGRIADLGGLDRLPNLAALDLSNNAVQNLVPVKRLRALGGLRLTHNRITDLTPLAGLPALSSLGVSGNAVTDLTALSSLVTLRHLGLAENQIHDLSPLARLTSLTELDVSRNDVHDVAPLAGLNQMERLTLSDNRIDDPAPLTGLPSLTMLDIARNKINSVGSFTAFASLTELWVGENPLRDLTPLVGLKSLTGVDVAGIDPRTPGLVQLRKRGVYVGAHA